MRFKTLKVCRRKVTVGLTHGEPRIETTWGVLETGRKKNNFCPCTTQTQAKTIQAALRKQEHWTNSLCWTTAPTPPPQRTQE